MGTPKPEKTPGAGPAGRALDDLDSLDGRLSKLVEAHRLPSESHEAAADRLMKESPNIFAEHKRERGRILARHSMGDASTGGV